MPGTVQSTVAYGISNWGVVAGNYRDSGGTLHGFVAYPEPGDPTWIGELDRDDDAIPDALDETPNTQDPNACSGDDATLGGTLAAATQASCRAPGPSPSTISWWRATHWSRSSRQ